LNSLLYLESSAIVKMVVREPESAALVALLQEWRQHVSSALSRVEVTRAVRRAGGVFADVRKSERAFERIALIGIEPAILATAADLDPRELRSLDAIHLATALALGRDLAALVTYDRRMQQAARGAGLVVWAPH
jgi:predicted nucleic acid-binding protein